MPSRSLLRDLLLFAGIWAAALVAVHGLRRVVDFNAAFYWPMSIFRPRLPGLLDLVAVLGAGVVFLVVQRRELWRRGLRVIIPAAIAIVLLGNLAQGGLDGFRDPVLGGWEKQPLQYWHDAQELPGFRETLADYERIQPTLRIHSASHPPGAVLLYRLLAEAGGGPLAAGLVTALISLIGSALLLPRLFARHLGEERALDATWLFFLLPAVQIYYASAFDAVVATCCFGVLACHGGGARSWLLELLFLLVASCLSFAALFLGPVLLWLDLGAGRRPWRGVGLGLAWAASLLLIRAATGFDYLRAFLTAGRLENPEGFRLFSEPLSYVATRLENAAEILLFLGPFLVAAILLGWRTLAPGARRFAAAGLVTLAAMFLTGAFRTGETARACLFILPFLVVPALGGGASWRHERPRGETWLYVLVFLQGMAMQLLGRYVW